ncbi:TorF family putative porin [Duganella radicis]|nr:TorF family putative porin [Duganella radicis]
MRVSTQFHQPIRTLALSVFPWLLALDAQAQLSGSAGIVSNYMYRGISLSADKPVARAAVNYDGTSGWFAGGQVVTGQLAVETHRSAQWSGYAGYAQRLPSGLSWETGVTAYAFPKNPNWNFREAFIGLAGDTLSARLHYSPDYLGLNERSLYGELNGGWVLTQRLQAFWHGGYYYSLDNARSNRSEARLGLATSYQAWRAQLSLDLVRLRGGTATDIYGKTSGGGGEVRHVIVLTVARAF